MKTILIIGGSHGIGQSIIEQTKDQANIINMSRTPPKHTDQLTHYNLDILEDPLPNLDHLGLIDGLVYCPGSITLKPFTRLTLDTFRKDFEINVLGTVKAIQAYGSLLKKSTSSSVVLFSSVATKIGMPMHASISASKSAIEGLTKSLAAEYATKIRFNAIAPTLTDTPLAQHILNNDRKKESMSERHPLKRYLQPDEVASFASYLLSEQSKSLSGQIFYLDSGIVSIKS